MWPHAPTPSPSPPLPLANIPSPAPSLSPCPHFFAIIPLTICCHPLTGALPSPRVNPLGDGRIHLLNALLRRSRCGVD